MLLRLLTLFVCLLTSMIGSAQQVLSRTTVLPAGGLQEDVKILRAAFEQLHPGLYRYNTRQQMDAAFDHLAGDFTKDQTLEAAFLRLSAFTAQVRCGHTYPSFFNQSDAVTTALFQSPKRLPFFFRWTRSKMVVTQDFTPDHLLPPGTVVASVNGIPAAEMLRRLLPLVRADGANDAKRIDLLQVQGVSGYEAADILLPIVFSKWTTPFHLAVKTPGTARSKSLTVEAVSYAERNKEGLATRVDPKSGEPLFTLRYLPDGAALLTMPTWVMYQGRWDWKTWLNDSLNEIAERMAPALIVDLRGNEGGDNVGQVILDRLQRFPAVQESYARLVRYRRIPVDLDPYLKTWDKSFKDWGDRAVELPQPWPTAPSVSYLRQIGDEETPVKSPTTALLPYVGKVFVLTDAANSSATYGFARTVQRQHLGKLVGEPTGGNKRGTNGGAFFFVRLPLSGLEVDLPLIGYFPSSPERDEGLQPDIRVASSNAKDGSDKTISTVESSIGRSPR